MNRGTSQLALAKHCHWYQAPVAGSTVLRGFQEARTLCMLLVFLLFVHFRPVPEVGRGCASKPIITFPVTWDAATLFLKFGSLKPGSILIGDYSSVTWQRQQLALYVEDARFPRV